MLRQFLRSGRAPNPKGPNLEKNQDRLKFSISLEIFKLAWKFQDRPPEFPTKIGVWWVARLKFSISLENFKILIFFKIWALRELYRNTLNWPKYDSKAPPRVPPRVTPRLTQKWLQMGSRIWSRVTFEPNLGHFGVGRIESLLSQFWVTLFLVVFQCTSVSTRKLRVFLKKKKNTTKNTRQNLPSRPGTITHKQITELIPEVDPRIQYNFETNTIQKQPCSLIAKRELVPKIVQKY